MKSILFSRQIGQGAPLIILHGLFGMSDNWLRIAKALSEKFSVYCLDLRNHGQSFWSDTHSYESMAKDVISFCEYKGFNQVHCIGHSMGGKLAMHIDMHFPKLFQSLVVVDIAPKNYLKVQDYTQNYAMHRTILEVMTSDLVSNVTSRSELKRSFDQTFQDPRLSNFIMKNIKRVGDRYRWRINGDILLASLTEIVSGVDLFTDQKQKSDTPALIVRGGMSEYISDKDLSLFDNLYHQLSTATFDSGGHWLHVECEQLLIDVLFDFYG